MLRSALLQASILLALLGWRLAPDQAQAYLLLPLWLGATLLILLANYELARNRRQVWLSQYLHGGSPWQKRLQYGYLGMVIQLILAIGLALVLLIKLLVIGPMLMLGMAFGLMMWLGLQMLLRQPLLEHVRSPYRQLLTRQLSANINTVLLGLLLITLLIFLPQPGLQGMGWMEAMAQHLHLSQDPGLLGMLVRSGELLDLSQKWLLQNTVGSVQQNGLLALLVWVLAFSSYFALSFAYCRLLIGTDILGKKWNPHNG
jgi:hypothetical protein